MLKRNIIISLIVTLPISILFMIWISGTLSFFFQASKFEDSSYMFGKNRNLYITGKREFLKLKYQFTFSSENNLNRDIHIYTKVTNLNSLNDNLPESGFKYKKSFLFTDKKVFSGKLRYRGDNLYHWLMPHKSWRFKTTKNNLYKNVRKWNFIIWKYNGLPLNHISYKLAKIIGILAPHSEIKTVSINNQDNGVKTMVEQIDENFLRNNQRMPNDIYKGDNIGLKTLQGISIPNIFGTPSIWQKVSTNNHYQKDNLVPLKIFLSNIQNKNNILMDEKSFVDYMLFIDLISTFHIDFRHNWVLSYDNYLEKFYPVVWDTGPWLNRHLEYNTININNNHIFSSFYNDYKLFIDKYYAVYNFFLKNEKDFFNMLGIELEESKEKINQIGYTFDTKGNYTHSEYTTKNIKKLKNTIKKRFNFVKESFLGEANLSDYKYILKDNFIRISISGNKLINGIEINSNSPINVENIYMSYETSNKRIKKKIPFELNTENTLLKLNVNLLARTEESNNSIDFKEATYDIQIPKMDLKNIKSILFSFLSYKEKSLFEIKKVSNINKQLFLNQKNIIKKTSIKKDIHWKGIKKLNGFNIINNNLIISAGTKIILDKNTTLKVLGKVTAIGTKERPIIFEAKDKTIPWNTFALKDDKANGSVFKHCIFKNGSGDKGDLYEYTAMLSIHNVKNLLIENCEFYDTKKTDDMVHVIYSDATFKNTKFIRSFSDALDVDISNVVIDNCEFINSGNDAIDLMTTNAIVTNSKFTNSKDKAISIGEGSNLLAVNNLIKGNAIGMQSKDTSKAYIYNSSFIDNNISIDAYHKNWRYNKGGTIILDNCLFEKNNFNATVGKKSKVIINNSDIDTPKNFNTKNIKKKKIIISNTKTIKFNLKESLFQNKTHLINKGERGYHE